MGAAAELAADELTRGRGAQLAQLRDLLHQRLRDALPGRVHLNGPEHSRLPNTLNISIDGTRGHDLLATAAGIAASTGSACHSGIPVLSAMGLDQPRALAALRLSLGRWTTLDDIETAAATVTKAEAPLHSRP